MSCTLSHECRVMLIAELLTASTDATRGWLRAEMDRTVDPMLDSIFNRRKTKLNNGLGGTQSGDCAQLGNRNPCLHDQSATDQIHQPSTSSHFNPQFVNMNYFYQQQQQNGQNNLNSNSNQQLSSQPQPMTIKEEIEPMPTHQVQSCSYVSVSNEHFIEQSNHNLTDQPLDNDAVENFQINLLDTEMQPQPLKMAHIKHNDHDDEECDCDECVDGEIEVKEEDEYDQVDDESSRPVKRQRLDSTQQSKLIQIMEEDNCQYDNGGQNIEDGHLQAMNTDHGRHNSDESMAIQQEELDANNAIGEEIATECTTNPIQPNLVHSNRRVQCSHCAKSFDNLSKLERHVRVHTGERPFQCDQCDKRFNVKGNLHQHQQIHQNIKSFQCHECDKHFTQKNHLDSHLLTHSGERPFACRYCAKSFATLGTRNAHEQAIHLHVKPYRCKQCAHTATTRSAAIQHIRTVHFGLPRTIKEQRELNIIDDRDARELMEKV